MKQTTTWITFASLVVATCAFGVSLGTLLISQVNARKTLAVDFTRKNIDTFTPARNAAWMDVMHTKPDELRQRLFDHKSLYKNDPAQDAAEYPWRQDCSYIMNILELQAQAYNAHVADNRIMWDSSNDELLVQGGLANVTACLQGVKGWETKLKTFALYKANLEKGRPSDLQEWTGMTISDHAGWWIAGVTWIGIVAYAFGRKVVSPWQASATQPSPVEAAARRKRREGLLKVAQAERELVGELIQDELSVEDSVLPEKSVSKAVSPPDSGSTGSPQ